MRYYKGRRFTPEPIDSVEYQLEKILNNGLTFIDNIRGGFLELVTVLGTNVIQHNLGHIPIGWIVVYQDGVETLHAVNVTSWTNAEMQLSASVGSVTVRIFVM